MFFRAAELTLQNGYDYFLMADRDTNLQSRTYSTPGLGGGFGGGFGYGGFGGGYWGPSWRYRGARLRSWLQLGSRISAAASAAPGATTSTSGPIDRYEATAEIVIGRKGPIPRDNIRAFDAKKVVDSGSGPAVVLPGQDQRR